MSETHRSETAGRGLRIVAKVICAGMGVLGVVALTAPTVAAVTGANGQSLSVRPSTIPAGKSVTISGVAPACTTVTLLSKAFSGANEFAGVPAVNVAATTRGQFQAKVTIPVSRTPGSYTISARACGGNLGITVTLTVTRGAPVPSTGASLGGSTMVPAVLLVAAGAIAVAATTRSRRTSA